MLIIEEPLRRIKGKEAPDLISAVLLEEGVDARVAINMCAFVNDPLKRKITICHDSLFEKQLRKICNENKHEMNEGNCRKAADEILDLFHYDPDEKIHLFIMNNQASIIVFLTLISIVVSIVIPMISKLF